MARLLPDLLSAYREFTTQSDSPEVFHAWIALGTIAGAAQRKIYMKARTFEVHTNLYIILTSPPGRSKKGAALNTGKNFLKAIEPAPNFASESGSFEGLVKVFTNISNPAHQSLSLFSMELGTLMATNPATMIDFLTDIFDGNADWTRQTVGHQTQTIKKPWLNLMAGTTPAWLGEHVGLLAMQGGLTARCIFPYSEERILENPWPEMDPEGEALFKAIVHDLSHIAMLEGLFKFEGGKEGDAYKWYADWYRDLSRFPKYDDVRTASYFDRKHIHLLKVAMALSLSYKDELVLTVEDLSRALALLNATEPGMRRALAAAGKNELADVTMRILTEIRMKGSMTYGQLLIGHFHSLKRGKQDLDQILEELAISGRIRRNGQSFTAPKEAAEGEG